jgi:alkanesulfonate monooxygenase SsuD/methylene tetrahydromethanopterin reductase-like flavin-dependent oxidoreductase (luciferase family)
VRFGIFLPNFGPFGDPTVIVDLAREAEDAGWDGLFIWDHMLFGTEPEPVLDPWVALTAVATATSRIRFGTAVTPLARRRPWKVARETVTLDHLSGGRLVLAVGLGTPPEIEFGTFGEPTDARLRAEMLDEALDVLGGLWSGEPFSYDGKHFTVSQTQFLPRPLQQPRIPVWTAGWWPNRRPFRRGARWDGVIPELVGGATPSPADVADLAAYVRSHRVSGEPFDIAINGYTEDGRPSEVALLEEYEQAGTTWWLERFEPTHRFSVDAVRRRIAHGPPQVARSTTVPPTEEMHHDGS